ncbi:MAG: ParB N-terminal domain-containing protein [Brevinemataceae bacterium]
MKMLINQIIVKKRIRKDKGSLESLKESLNKFGQIYPIIVNSKNILICGERRLTAARELGWETIDVIVRDLPPVEILELELEENSVRKDFSIQEYQAGLKRKEHISSNIFQKIALFFQSITNFIRKRIK